MYKSILAATALALVASVAPAAAYERDYNYGKSSTTYGKGYYKTYSDGYSRDDRDRREYYPRRWRHHHDHDYYGYGHRHHRRHWRQRYYGDNW